MTVKQVGLVGSGIMSSGVAEVVAKAGMDVALRSRTQEAVDAMVAGLEKSLAKQVEKGKLDDAASAEIRGRVRAVTDLSELSSCDLVLESVVEDITVKKQLFTDLDDVCANAKILATNTSTLSVGDIAAATKNPERVCGIHFFNPAPVMPLVEIVRAEKTGSATVSGARTFAEACGKTVVDVIDRAGFIVNSLLFPYLNNAVKALDAGLATRDDIDAAMKGGCNFPMGPLELLDLVGLDTSLSILEALHDEYQDPNYVPAPMLEQMVGDGRLGRKTGQGFYDYSK
ncbi:MAG: 3-hydroxybutyryl-CoA dehydrogenase [Actinobacteria bacterium]|nr:3-hydroxybutyryl-CoA dehydrogenase [Actinomycetota bacterium]